MLEYLLIVIYTCNKQELVMKLFDKLNSYLTNYHYYCQLNWFSMLNIFRNLFLMGYPSVTILIIKPNSFSGIL